MRVEPHGTVEELERRIRNASGEPKLRQRLRVIRLALDGLTAEEVAERSGLSRRQVQTWVQRFNAQGWRGLEDLPGRGPRLPLTSEQQTQLSGRLAAGPLPEDGVCTLRAKEVRRILEREFGVVRKLSSVYYLLHRLGYSSLVPRSRHPQADPARQEEFKKKELPAQLAKIRQEHPEKKLRIFFEDEARLGQQGTLTRVWAPTGSRPRAVKQVQYEYLWVIAAVCPETGQAEGLLAPLLNTQVINIFLRQFAATIPAGEHAVLIWDGAGFHTSRDLQVPANVSLIRLPPVSPELNPTENLWHYLRSHHWSNRAYANYSALEAAALDAWRRTVLVPQNIQSICHAPYLDSAVIG